MSAAMARRSSCSYCACGNRSKQHRGLLIMRPRGLLHPQLTLSYRTNSTRETIAPIALTACSWLCTRSAQAGDSTLRCSCFQLMQCQAKGPSSAGIGPGAEHASSS